MAMELRKLLAIGTGIGIEIGASDLRATIVRVRPSGVTVLGTTVIAEFRERPAAEWGAEYARFTGQNGASHLAATVILPRQEVIVRQIALPGISHGDLASAVGYQIDSLHPYGEDEARYSWARIRSTSAIVVAVARGSVIDRYASRFEEAGIKISSFTFSAAVLYSALRLFGAAPRGGFLSIAASDGAMELYGESEARPLFTAILEGPSERAVSLAAAELRLDPSTGPAPLDELLPNPKRAPEGYELSREALPFAAALAGACPRLALPANLLPPERRSSSSRLMYVPTAALTAVLLILLVGLGAQARYQERQHLSRLETEIARLEPRAAAVARAERSIEGQRARIRLLDGFRRQTKTDLDTLTALTMMLSPPAWLNNLELTRDSVTISGEAEQAAPLLKLLDGSPMLRNSEFTMPLSRSANVERFRIRAVREGVPQ